MVNEEPFDDPLPPNTTQTTIVPPIPGWCGDIYIIALTDHLLGDTKSDVIRIKAPHSPPMPPKMREQPCSEEGKVIVAWDKDQRGYVPNGDEITAYR